MEILPQNSLGRKFRHLYIVVFGHYLSNVCIDFGLIFLDNLSIAYAFFSNLKAVHIRFAFVWYQYFSTFHESFIQAKQKPQNIYVLLQWTFLHHLTIFRYQRFWIKTIHTHYRDWFHFFDLLDFWLTLENTWNFLCEGKSTLLPIFS